MKPGRRNYSSIFLALLLAIGSLFGGVQAATAAGPGVCSNDPAVSCSANADCGAGTCYLPTSGGDILFGQQCLAQASGIEGGCTANDVSVATTTNLVVKDRDPAKPGVQGCLFPGDIATISFVAKFHSTATNRYDVGVWVSQTGGSALTGAAGTCAVANFPSAPTPPWLNLETNISTDSCGDISSDADVFSSIQEINVTCTDTNGDGLLDISTCLSWDQNATTKDEDACTSPIQAIAGTTSKCNCEQLPGIAILVPGKIKVDKVTVDASGNPLSDSTLFNFSITGPDADLPDNFQLTNAAEVHTSPSLDAAADTGTQYTVTETANAAWSTTATCVSDQAGRPAQDPTAGSVTLHAGETLTCTFTNKRVLVDLCAGVTCQANTVCAQYACDPADGVCKPTYAPSGIPCGGSGAACDALDTCNGSGTCVDNVKPSGTVCLAGTGTCNPDDVCDGTSKACTAVFANAGTACGGSDAACDALDTCNGSGSCTDNVKAAGIVCLTGTGICNPDDTCNGTSKACTAVYAANGTTCVGTSNGGVCDGTDSCNGAGACVDGYLAATTICNPSAGQCDVAESCTGTSGACPANAFQPLTTSCSVPPNGECYAQDSCDGSGTCAQGANLCDFNDAARVVPASTTCVQYKTGTASLTEVQYFRKGITLAVISSSNPGTFALFDGLELSGPGTGAITVTETNGAPAQTWMRRLPVLGASSGKPQVTLYKTLTCEVVHDFSSGNVPAGWTLTLGTGTSLGNVKIEGVPAGNYILAAKYNADVKMCMLPDCKDLGTTYTFSVNAGGANSGSAPIPYNKK